MGFYLNTMLKYKLLYDLEKWAKWIAMANCFSTVQVICTHGSNPNLSFSLEIFMSLEKNNLFHVFFDIREMCLLHLGLHPHSTKNKRRIPQKSHCIDKQLKSKDDVILKLITRSRI